MLVTGDAIPLSRSLSAQVIDVSLSSPQTCNSLPEPPDNTFSHGAIGGYGYLNEPLVCGGTLDFSTTFYSECQSYSNGIWSVYPHSLKVPRSSSAYTSNPNNLASGRIVVFGGLPASTAVISSIEVLTPAGWTTSTATLPRPMSNHCSASLNLYDQVLIVEASNSASTFVFNVTEGVVFPGPDMNLAPSNVICSAMQDSLNGKTKVVVAHEGTSAKVEILDVAGGSFLFFVGLELDGFVSRIQAVHTLSASINPSNIMNGKKIL